MERAQPETVRGQLPQHVADPVTHFTGGLVGERDSQHLVGPHTFVGDQICHALGQDARLAGAGSGQYQNGTCASRDSLALLGVEFIEEIHDVCW